MSQAREKLTLKELVNLKRTWTQHSGALRYHALQTVPLAAAEFNAAASLLGQARLALELALLEEGAKQPEEADETKRLS